MNEHTFLTAMQLAVALGRDKSFVTAMKRAGYKFEYQAARKTTLGHALRALAAAPEFVAAHYLRSQDWQALPKVLAEPGKSLGEMPLPPKASGSRVARNLSNHSPPDIGSLRRKTEEVSPAPKLLVRRATAVSMLESSEILERLERAGWVRPICKDGKVDMFSVAQLQAAVRRTEREVLP